VGRVDVLSFAPTANKYAFFPSGAFAWKLAEEGIYSVVNGYQWLKFTLLMADLEASQYPLIKDIGHFKWSHTHIYG